MIVMSRFAHLLRLTVATALSGSLALISGCTQSEETATELTPVTMQLDWIYNAQFAGLYQAVEQGYYADAGLEVTIRPVDRAQNTVDLVLQDGIIFGSAESNVILGAHTEGAPIVALATMFQGSPMGWMYTAESGITSLADLADKRIGIHPDGERVISLVFQSAGLQTDDFTLPEVGYDIGIVQRGEVDAMQAYYIDEFVKLQQATNNTSGMILAKDHGYAAYSQVFFAKTETVAAQPETTAAFLAASKKGWEYALAHPEETIDLILAKYNPELDRAYQLASLEKIGELITAGGTVPVLSPMDRAVWEKAMAAYVDLGVLPHATDLDKLLDFQYNP